MTIAATATIERTIDAPIDRVFAAFTDPALIVQWFSPNPDHELSFVGDVAVNDHRALVPPPRVVAQLRPAA